MPRKVRFKSEIDKLHTHIKRDKVYKSNSTGYRGVTFRRDRNHYRATADYKGKLYYFGSYPTALRAYEAYLQGMNGLNGELVL